MLIYLKRIMYGIEQETKVQVEAMFYHPIEESSQVLSRKLKDSFAVK